MLNQSTNYTLAAGFAQQAKPKPNITVPGNASTAVHTNASGNGTTKEANKEATLFGTSIMTVALAAVVALIILAVAAILLVMRKKGGKEAPKGQPEAGKTDEEPGQNP